MQRRYWPSLYPRLRRNDIVYYIDNGEHDTGRVITATRKRAFVIFDDDPDGSEADWYLTGQLMLVKGAEDK